jgi:hypothetical protein
MQTPYFILHFVLSFPKVLYWLIVFFICMHGFTNRPNMVRGQWPHCQFFIGFISSGAAHGYAFQNFRSHLQDFGKNVPSPRHASSTSKEHLQPSTRSASPSCRPCATAPRHPPISPRSERPSHRPCATATVKANIQFLKAPFAKMDPKFLLHLPDYFLPLLYSITNRIPWTRHMLSSCILC